MKKIFFTLILIGSCSWAKLSPQELKNSFKEGTYSASSLDCSSGKLLWIEENGTLSLILGGDLVIPDIDAKENHQEDALCTLNEKAWSEKNKIIDTSFEKCNGSTIYRKIEIQSKNGNIVYDVYNKKTETEDYKLKTSCTLTPASVDPRTPSSIKRKH